MKGIRIVLLGACLATSRVAFADGGTVRASELRGDFRITVFTSPTPLVVGAADMSVLVLDTRSGLPATDVTIRVRGTASLRDGTVAEQRSTLSAATNKMMQAATLTFDRAGTWHIDVAVEGVEPPLQFDVEVGEAAPAWHEMSLWIGWPLLVVAGFAVRQWTSARRV